MNRPKKITLVYFFLSLFLIVVYAFTDHVIDRKNIYPSTIWHIAKPVHHMSIFFAGIFFSFWAVAQEDKWKSLYWLLGLVALSGVYFAVFEFLMRVV